MRRLFSVAVLLIILSAAPARTGTNTVERTAVPGEAVEQARRMVSNLFSNLKEGKTDEIAKWVVAEIGYALDASTKVKNTGEYKSKLDIVLLSPPAGPYGKLDGYDQIDEAYLPGSARYFRLSYISYHEGSPLLWEFRFYVKPDRKVALHFISWSEKNPFEYLSTSDMLLNHWLKW